MCYFRKSSSSAATLSCLNSISLLMLHDPLCADPRLLRSSASTVQVQRKARENLRNHFCFKTKLLGVKENGLRAAFMTNHGIEFVTLKNNGISVHSDTKFMTLFHMSRAILSSFASMSDNFFTLDEEKKLIFLTLLST